ncbi:MAG: hypothetical protein LAO09_12005 [Acidobacteriia bacterium]|nr:hypothetical protein [Terriglobia bacterium]
MNPATAYQEELDTNPEYRQRLADLFHALSQPLTTLRCCLDVSLQKPRSAQRYQRDLQAVLQQVELVTRLVICIRDLVDAASPAPEPALPLSVPAAVTDNSKQGVLS